MNKALVVIDIQNDITKHYKDIIEKINVAIDWAVKSGMYVVYIKHNNIQKVRNLCLNSKSFRIMPL